MNLTAYSQDSTKFIDGFKITKSDTLACFKIYKVKEFAKSKVDYMECDSLLEITELELRLTIRSWREMLIQRDAAMQMIDIKDTIIAEYRLNEENIIVEIEKLSRKNRNLKRWVGVLSGVAGGLATSLLILNK